MRQNPKSRCVFDNPDTFTPRPGGVDIPMNPDSGHGTFQLLCKLPSLQPCMGILRLTACQPAKGTQTGYGAMPAMPYQGEAGCKECTLTTINYAWENSFNRDMKYKHRYDEKAKNLSPLTRMNG